MLHCLQIAINLADHHCNMCMRELPSEVRVLIFCLALELPIAGALLLDWLNLALVSQRLLGSPSLCCVTKPRCPILVPTNVNFTELISKNHSDLLHSCLHA